MFIMTLSPVLQDKHPVALHKNCQFCSFSQMYILFPYSFCLLCLIKTLRRTYDFAFILTEEVEEGECMMC